MSTDRSALVSTLHNAAQKATSEAQAIEDPSTRRAITELAEAIRAVARHLKDAD
ncbi:hypothetical protein [Nocardioides humilatus]|uniref:hypothetical protein n=1 Tax=Nocardioides humilatus TaxID=2607660 RepID=UPI00165EE23F|nr:hypothetical protein [Nocardioides humilatus]